MSMRNTKTAWGIDLVRKEERKWGDLATIMKQKSLYNLTESGNQSLCQPEAEDQLGTSHQQLGGQALEETGGALVLEHLRDNLEARLGVLEVAVLNTGLDHVQRSGDNQGGTGTADGGDKVLAPAGGVVVAQFVDVLLGEGGTTEESERARGVTGGSPASAAVKTHTLISDNLEKATATEGLGVGLTLNLQHIEREEDDLSNTDQTG